MSRPIVNSVCLLLAVFVLAALVPESARAQSSNLPALYKRVEQLDRAGKFDKAAVIARRALTVAERQYGRRHPWVAVTAVYLALLHRRMGRYSEAEHLYKRALSIYRKVHGRAHPSVGVTLINLATLYRVQGRFAEAERHFRRALAIYQKGRGRSDPNFASALNNLAVLYQQLGRYAKAEQLYRRALLIREKKLAANHPATGQTLNDLAGLYYSQGRYAEAVTLYERALAVLRKVHGREHPNVASVLNSLAHVIKSQGHFAKAARLYERALTIKKKTVGPDHPLVGMSFIGLATLYHVQGRFADAKRHYQRAIETYEKALGPHHPRVGIALNNLGELYEKQGRDPEAKQLYRRSLAIKERMLGYNHPLVATTLNDLGWIERKQGRWAGAYAYFLRAVAIQERRAIRRSHRMRRGGIPRRYRYVFSNLSMAAWHLAEQAPSRSAVLRAKAFEAAQWYGHTSTGAALAQMSARFGAGNKALNRLVRARQDLNAQWQALDRRLIKAISAAPTRHKSTLVKRLRDRSVQTDRRIAELDTRLARDFPQYNELTNPKPLKISEAQQLLAPNEALIFLLLTKKGTFVWAVTSDGVSWKRSNLGRKEVAAKVRALRGGLDPTKLQAGNGAPFNLETAFDLYAGLLKPVEGLIRSKSHLLIVPAGALTSLPFHVLVTQKPLLATPDFAAYREAAWLIKTHSISVLPSVSSLRALRAFAKKSHAKHPFIGYGDPVFSRREQGSADGKQARAALRGYASYFRGANADLDKLSRGLDRLADTADELRTVARLLDAPESTVILRRQATERAVKRAPLHRYRVVYFATHALVAGEVAQVGGQAEPALALTLPAKASNTDDGLLMASEVAQLQAQCRLGGPVSLQHCSR